MFETGKFIKQIMKAYPEQQLVIQKYIISNRDILTTFQ